MIRLARSLSIAAACSLLSGAVWACPPDYPAFGAEGRSDSTEFSNSRATVFKHESWAGALDRLVFHAAYFDETNDYGHNVLGRLRDNKGLTIRINRLDEPTRISCPTGVYLPEGLVFEGVAPLVVDVSGDGLPEVVTTVSSATQGARVTIFDRRGTELASTPFIGTRFRWLALIGAADLDGDGFVEIAYIDRPHLAKTLRIWRYVDGALEPVANLPGFTNHRIGEEDIAGGIRNCGAGPEMITASANWTRMIASTLEGGRVVTNDIGRHDGRASFALALACESLPR